MPCSAARCAYSMPGEVAQEKGRHYRQHRKHSRKAGTAGIGSRQAGRSQRVDRHRRKVQTRRWKWGGV